MSHVTTLNFNQGGQDAQVVLEWDEGSSIAALANSMELTFWPAMQGETSAATDLISIQVGDTATGITVPINDNGGGATTALPSTCAVLVSKNVIGGRNGRFFWPGLPEGAIDPAGRFSAGQLAPWQTAVDTALGAMGAAGHTMVVTNSLGVENPVDSLTVRPYIGTQRRRLFN